MTHHAINMRHRRTSIITQTLLKRDDQPTITSPRRRHISAFPLCTVTDTSCIAQRTNAPLGMRPLSAAVSPQQLSTYAWPSTDIRGQLCLKPRGTRGGGDRASHGCRDPWSFSATSFQNTFATSHSRLRPIRMVLTLRRLHAYGGRFRRACAHRQA